MSENIEMPHGWSLVKLGEIVADPQKDLVDGPFGSNLKADEYTDSGVPVFKIQNIKENRFVDRNINFITEKKAKSLSRHSFASGDLIITKLGSPLGLCCKVPKEYRYGIIVADLMRLRPDSSVIYDQFLIYAINSNVVQNQFKAITKGTTRPRVNLTIVREIQIPFPPLPEQHRIVAKIEELFSSLDKGIESLKTAQQQLKVYRQAVLKWAFEGRLTEEWRISNPYTDRYLIELIEKIEIFNSKKEGQDIPRRLPPMNFENIFDIPFGWNWFESHKICSSVRDGTHDTPKYVEKGIPLITSKNLKDGILDYSNIDYISEKDHFEISKRSAVDIDDILFGMIGTIGNPVLIVNNNHFSIKNVGLFKKNENLIIPRYLKYWLQSWVCERILKENDLIKGTTQKFISLGGLRVLPIPLPCKEEQSQIVAEIESRLSVCDKIEESIEQSLKQSETLRQSILKKAFEGKLVPQDPNDEPASKLLERIKAQREKPTSKKRSPK